MPPQQRIMAVVDNEPNSDDETERLQPEGTMRRIVSSSEISVGGAPMAGRDYKIRKSSLIGYVRVVVVVVVAQLCVCTHKRPAKHHLLACCSRNLRDAADRSKPYSLANDCSCCALPSPTVLY
jgi:hypothetical protein